MKPQEVFGLGPEPKRWPIPGAKYRTKDRRHSMEIIAIETTFLAGYGVECQWDNPPNRHFHISLDDLSGRFDAIDNVIKFPITTQSSTSEQDRQREGSNV